MMDLVSRVIYQNLYLYYSIQKNNKETEKARKTLIDESIYLSNLIKEEEEEDFVKNIVESAKHLNDEQEALKRSDEEINLLNHKSNLLNRSVGMEVGLKHQYSGNIHVGIIDKVTAKNVVMKTIDQELISMKISHVDILSQEEVFEWKKNNLNLEYYDLSVMFPSKCDEEFLIKVFKNIEPVIDVKVIDTIMEIR